MQDFSILQLLRTLAAANGNGAKRDASEENNAKADGNNDAAAAQNTKAEKPKSENSLTHVREKGEIREEQKGEEQAAFAYENFLARHDRAVARIQKNRSDGEDSRS